MSEATPEPFARIYTLSDPRTLEVRYVGMTTKTLKERLKGHLRNVREKNHRAFWIRSLLAAGVRPEIAELEIVPVGDRAAAERRWIEFYLAQGADLVNATLGGEGLFGYKHSDEARRKIAASKLGKPGPTRGIKMGPRTPETREALRVAALRQYEDPAQREAVSRVHKGKVISAEHREIVGIAAKRKWEEWRASGKTVSDETRAKIVAASKARGSRPQSAETRAKLSQNKRQ